MRIKDLLSGLTTHYLFHGNEAAHCSEAVSIFDLKAGGKYPETLTWLKEIYTDQYPDGAHIGLVITDMGTYAKIGPNQPDTNFLVTESPRALFFQLVSKLLVKEQPIGIEASAQIDPSVKIPDSCYIGHNVIIEAGAKIGENCRIMHNSVIFGCVTMHENVRIGCNCTIGNVGFGYEQDENDSYFHVPHIGRVELCKDVFIHNNTCIDRAVLGTTILKENVKIDNLVHIAHNVEIGENSLIIANAMLGGSAKVGKDCWVAPSAAVKNKISIADKTLVGLGATIIRNTTESSVVIGNPGVEMDQYKRWSRLKSQLISGSE